MPPRADVTRLLANNWGSLPHEDGRPRRLLHHSQFGRDEDTKARIQALGHDLGECVQTLLERNGYEISHRDDLKPADHGDYRQVKVKCVACGMQLMTLGCDANLNASLSGLAIRSLTQLTHECVGAA